MACGTIVLLYVYVMRKLKLLLVFSFYFLICMGMIDRRSTLVLPFKLANKMHAFGIFILFCYLKSTVLPGLLFIYGELYLNQALTYFPGNSKFSKYVYVHFFPSITFEYNSIKKLLCNLICYNSEITVF